MPPSARRASAPAGKRGKSGSIKKEKATYHKQKYAREQMMQRKRGGAQGKPSTSHQAGSSAGQRQPRSARTNNIDIHLAAKVSAELRVDLSKFKCRLNATDLFGQDLGQVFKFIPPPFVQQHLPDDVRSLRSYMSKFERGAPSIVHAFIMWYEWASYELNKGKSHGHSSKKHEFGRQEAPAAGDDEIDEREAQEEQDANNEKKHGKFSQTRAALSKTVKEREHIRALLQMCLRHNSSRRREGQHAFVNHLKTKLADDADCHSLKSLRETAHHAIPYALSRLLLGMVTEDMAMILLHAHTLFLALRETTVTPSVILSLIGEELTLDARLKAAKTRLEARAAKTHTMTQQQPADEELDDIDPDAINDPTKGERNQRLIATVFAAAVLVANTHKLQLEDARHLAHYLCFAYIEQKALRVLTANILFKTFEAFPALWEDKTVLDWLSYAFFIYPKLEYYRPEGVQLLLRLMMMEEKPQNMAKGLPDVVLRYAAMDPLEPSTVEQLANALFRKEQVTMVYPMVHPVWTDWFEIVVQRCAAGESMKEHLSTMMHNAIAPYRRGNADAPRRALFQQLVSRLGQLAVQNDDAEQRAEMLQMASKTVGYGQRTLAKATDISELRCLPLDMLDRKVRDLLRQYRAILNSDPSAYANRTWVLRELRSCLYVPLRDGVACTYIDEAAEALLEFGFYPTPPHRDTRSMNRAVFLFAEVFSFTYAAALSRPKCTLCPLNIIHAYLEAERREKTRYTTGLNHGIFRKARNRIVEALEKTSKRSVLFYAERDMHILLVLLFLVLSTDDHTNEEAKALATSTVPDLCHFFLTGSLETIDLFFDVLMALVMRSTAPIHVIPLLTCIRRIATGYLLKFARYVRERVTLDLVLAPLREAFHTDDREKARQAKAKGEIDKDDSDDDDDNDNESNTCNDNDKDDEDGEDEEDDSDGTSDISESEESTSTETTAPDDEAEDDNGEAAATADEDAAMEEEPEEENDDDEEEEEAPTQQYIDALKGMIGNVDLQFVYPVDASNKDKSNVVRAIQIAARVGASMRSPLILHIFQVLLAVCRENVKSPDDVIFNSAISSIQLLMMSKHRYFGRFLVAEELFQLLSDIQSFCRKLDHVLVRKESKSAKHAVVIRRRMGLLRDVALRVFHFVAFLAYKNHAGEDVRVTLVEFYKSIFCDRGWDDKKRLPGIKRDMHHYRHGFGWVVLPTAFEKFREVEGIAGPQRVRVFKGCCQMIEAMLPRLSGLGMSLKTATGVAIASFLQSTTIRGVYEMKYTLLYDYLHCLKMVAKYNSRVHLDTVWLASVVEEAVNDDSFQMSAASIRLLAALERLLSLTPRAKETKAPVPVKVLYQQFEKQGRKEKAAFYKRAKRVREKVVKALVAYRNGDLTDAERALKRRRRETMKIDDRLKRQVLREERSRTLTKEEKEEKRKRIMMAKQERIAKNRERKRRLHEHREKAFQRWREQKLATAAAME
ncbi:hypothetical protein TraAM80_02735 [Trypanosoma rangeli]|uniref:Uncharacterized protein n=1 Tax=Trypanosoma rangeli TaxID=5698 RepID=A0A3S5IRR9_TRYRA|nr:uncharacterized protein TraAM80_02735 [Trypanosoma rangeli]RNF08435.1 hypothetical protein TraAM80_02735 [Trypanosoma rangeli]|eukprot:RNF08435.1 hypothetical protein TraAM80_02735 [Trypanosoma rangeli]